MGTNISANEHITNILKLWKTRNIMVIAVYFDQRLGAKHPKRWSQSSYLVYCIGGISCFCLCFCHCLYLCYYYYFCLRYCFFCSQPQMLMLWLYCVSARSCSYFYGSTFTYFIIKGHPFNECFHQGLFRFENWQLCSFVHVAVKIVALTESKTFGKKCNWEIIKRKVLDMASGRENLYRGRLS